jgi:hypothetical protein
MGVAAPAPLMPTRVGSALAAPYRYGWQGAASGCVCVDWQPLGE